MTLLTQTLQPAPSYVFHAWWIGVDWKKKKSHRKKKPWSANDFKLRGGVVCASLLLTVDMTGVSLSKLDLEWRRRQGSRRPQMRLHLRRVRVRRRTSDHRRRDDSAEAARPERAPPLPPSLVWLSRAVKYRLSPACLMADANWPPFRLSSAQMKRFPASCDGACHNLIRQIKKLTAVTLSPFRAPRLISYNDDFFFFFPHRVRWNCCSALPSTILWEGRLLRLSDIWMFVISGVLCTALRVLLHPICIGRLLISFHRTHLPLNLHLSVA